MKKKRIIDPNDGLVWESPAPLLATTKLADFPPDCFPPALRNYSLLEAKTFGVDPNISLMSALTIAAAAIDDGNVLALDKGWKESPRMWTNIIGASGVGKTPVQDALIKPLGVIDAELHDEAKRDFRIATAGKKKSEWPEPFAQKIHIITNDPTIEGMRDILKNKSRGILQYAREFVSLMGSFDAYRSSGHARDRGLYIQLWDGGPVTIDRASAESVLVPNWGASILSSIQPSKLGRMNEESDGFMQRFQLIWARSRVEPENVKSGRNAAEDAYCSKIAELYDLDCDEYTLSERARGYFDTWRRGVLAEAALYELTNPPYHSALMKFEKMALRISLILHLSQGMDDDHDYSKVLLQTMRSACRILEAQKTHLRKFYLDSDISRGLGIGAELLQYVLARLQDPEEAREVPQRDIEQHVRSFYKANAREREAVIEHLITGGWFLPSKSLRTTGKVTRWAINPELEELYRAESIAEAKRRAAAKKAIEASAAIRRAER